MREVFAKYIKPARDDVAVRPHFSNFGVITDVRGSTATVHWYAGTEQIPLRDLELEGTKQGKPVFKVR